MLTWVGVGLALCAAAVVVRWVLHRYDALGRRHSFPTLAVAVLMVPAIGAATPGMMRWREERVLERAASALAGFDVTVECQTFGGAFLDAGSELGFVRYGADGVPERRTLIKYEPCADLRRYLRSNHAAPSLDEVIAVHVLAHEAMHMAGLTSEAKAECAAVQRDAAAARMLGADPFEAAALAQTYWRSVYPRMPEGYTTGECRRGGALDEGLPDAPWALPAG